MVILAVAGCNGLLGLDRSELDHDRDGVVDLDDNCSLDANPQQRDSDRDGLGDVCDCVILGADRDLDGIDDACDDCIGKSIGVDSGGNGIDDGCETCAAATGIDVDGDGLDDACDPCTLGPDHDEDLDGVADGCDNCPAQSNADQRTTGGAVLGEACERGGLRSSRFDPLVEQEVTLWPGIVPGWTWDADGLVLDRPTTRTTLATLTQPFVVETRAVTDSSISLVCLTSTGNATCSLGMGRTLELSVVSRSLPVRFQSSGPIPGAGAVRFQLSSDGATNEFRCEALDDSGAVIATVAVDGGLSCDRLRISASGPSRLEYLWIVTP